MRLSRHMLLHTSSLLLGLEGILLFLEFVQEVASLAVKLLRRKLPVLELLHLLLSHISRRLTRRKLLSEIRDSRPSDLLLLKRDPIS